MSRSLGRMFFVAFIWVYSLVYFLEVLELEDLSEKMTIVAVFWLFSAFAALELIILLRSLLADSDIKHPFSKEAALKVMQDKKSHLALALLLYLWAIPQLGFYTSSFAAFCVSSLVLGNRGPLKVIIPALVVLLVIYFTFSYSLKLTLPQGFIF